MTRQPVIMDGVGLRRTIIRLSHEIAERNEGMEDVVLVGVKRGGEIVANRLRDYFRKAEGIEVACGGIDIGMTRDDLVSEFFVPDAEKNELGFSVTGKKVVLCDDVLHTGRSAVAAIEAIFRLGRPKKIQLLVLVDRGGRELPVRADYVGKNVPTSSREYVSVALRELGAAEDKLTIVKEKKC
ncbi:MAG: bifunctional pyr operon transcriptional regulator/uracil phosphoribosyltransferase PyrR [Candidatus Gallimonas sp.]